MGAPEVAAALREAFPIVFSPVQTRFTDSTMIVWLAMSAAHGSEDVATLSEKRMKKPAGTKSRQRA